METATQACGLPRPKDTRLRRRLQWLRHELKKALLIRGGPEVRTLGEESSGCAYAICPRGLGSNSIVYSGGVGKDISFEHALVREFGCSIVLLDPSPIGLETMSLPENQIPQFRFCAVGLAGRSGTLRLAPPFDSNGDSWFSAGTGSIEVPCSDLATLMQQNRHEHIDLLKIDIEGAEYGVIDQIIENRIPVGQILVEFHDGILPGIRWRDTLRVTLKLIGAGYKLISEVGQVDTFLRS